MTKALILCAGKGIRLLPLTENNPKPMLLAGKKPLLEYNVKLCKKYGIKEIFINTSYLPEKIKEYFGDGKKFGVKINYSYEPDILGTAGSLNNFKKYLDKEPFLIIYGDNLTDLKLDEIISFHKEKGALATIFLHREKMPDENTTPGVVVVNKKLEIQRIIENPLEKEKLSKISYDLKFTNAGIYVLSPEIFNLIPKGVSDFAKDIFPKALREGYKIFGFRSSCFFRELGSRKRYMLTNNQLCSKEIKLDFMKYDS